MIASLFGNLEYKDTQFIIVNVNGVGYKVTVTADLLSNSHLNSSIKVFTYTHVKEDALELYGFSSVNELKLFELMIGVSGIGPKTAIGAFSVGSVNELIQAIRNGDVDYFTKVPRLGKKNAQKLIIELKNKLGSTVELDLSEPGQENDDLILALKSFGFTADEARDAIKNIDIKAKTDQEKIKLALKYLGR